MIPPTEPKEIPADVTDDVTDPRVRLLMLLAQGYSVTKAADEVGISRMTAYRWKDADPSYAELWADALEQGADRLEDEARRRAVDGVESIENVYFQGEVVGQKKRIEYSDKMLEILLKAKRASSFNPAVKIESTNKTEVTGTITHALSAPAHALATLEITLLYDPRYRDMAPVMLPVVRQAIAALPEAEVREVTE